MTALNSVPAQSGEGPRLELADVVERDVEEMEVADAGEGVLLDLCSVWTNQKSDSDHESLFSLFQGGRKIRIMLETNFSFKIRIMIFE